MPRIFSIPKISSRTYKVWLRNKDVFMKTIKINFIPQLLEPILYLFGIGYGLGFFVREIDGLPYVEFIAPALICISMMNSAFFESTFASFVRMYYQKTFDAIINTPLNIDEVIFGEILWASTKSMINASIILLVVSALQLVRLPESLLLIPLSFLVGVVFASIGMCFTSLVPKIEFFNYPIFLLITPMYLFSGTFFPMSILPEQIQTISLLIFPLAHAVNISRWLTTGIAYSSITLSLLWLVVVAVPLTILSINLMKKRLIV
ncbi:ABC transporter permease [[Eubacterium] cellulosolvens]